MTNHEINALMTDARNHLNHRSRGRDARIARLQSAGIPTDREGLSRWVEQVADKKHEAAGGIYHACTVRVANGADADLPTAGAYGCRISRVPLQAESVADDPEMWAVAYGKVGPGYMEHSYVSREEAATAEAACDLTRRELLASGDCFRTRAEARAAVAKMLVERAGERV